MTWTYTFFRHDSHGMPWPCQDSACSAKRAVYRLVAEDGDKTGAKNLCLQCSAKSASRLGISFPPVESRAAMLGEYDVTGWSPVFPSITKFDSRPALGQGQ